MEHNNESLTCSQLVKSCEVGPYGEPLVWVKPACSNKA